MLFLYFVFLSNESSNPSSPVETRCNDSGFFDSARHQRSNSKKHLRHDYARSKKRNIFRTYESSSGGESTLESRRNSLKEMRQFRSLPPTAVNLLSMLIQSKVRVATIEKGYVGGKKRRRKEGGRRRWCGKNKNRRKRS